nr:amidohydrolase family protein [Sphingopyxis sp. GW247-27LB]
MPFVDVHSHVTPFAFPDAPSAAVRGRWPCMHCSSPAEGTVMIGDAPFRKLDNRSWNVSRRIEDMDRDGVAMQVLSPMPELLSYWLSSADAELICDTSNRQIAEMIAAAPRRFRGLGAVTLQDPKRAARMMKNIRREFGLSGVEIGSNIDGEMLGGARFDPFWAAAEEEGMAVFVHALHPLAAKPIAPSPQFTAFSLFPIDVAMAAASLLMSGVMDRFPTLRIGFSHGGGALGAILGRLDTGWERTDGYAANVQRRPSEQARALFYDSNVYDPAYLRHLATTVVPGQVFAGTDYPYEIMQQAPASFIHGLGLNAADLESLSIGAASRFLDEDLSSALKPGTSQHLEGQG